MLLVLLRKGTVNNCVMSRHFDDNKRQINDLHRKSLLKYKRRFQKRFSNGTLCKRGIVVSFACLQTK